MASQRDIAANLGVSIATVSTVLSGKYSDIGISDNTAVRVKREAKRLDYRRNLTASGLRTSKHYAIGLLLNNPSELLYAELLTELQAYLGEYNYAGVSAFWHSSADVAKAFESVISRGVDGIITCHHDLSMVPEGLPVVTFEKSHDGYDSLSRDREGAVREAFVFLHSLGHRHIGMVNMNRAENGKLVKSILKEFSDSPRLTWGGDGTSSNYLIEARKGAVRMLTTAPEKRPTALICRNDTVALQSISVAGSLGIAVPRDLSVIGFDNISIGKLANPPLTSLGTRPDRLARQLVDLMVRRLENPDAPIEHVQVEKPLIIRNSCGNVPVRSK